eukprot:13654084-Ditylum_brightwellii.AAC.1
MTTPFMVLQRKLIISTRIVTDTTGVILTGNSEGNLYPHDRRNNLVMVVTVMGMKGTAHAPHFVL